MNEALNKYSWTLSIITCPGGSVRRLTDDGCTLGIWRADRPLTV
jgi:hypothetical protein